MRLENTKDELVEAVEDKLEEIKDELDRALDQLRYVNCSDTNLANEISSVEDTLGELI
jgi:hypothetical protein